MKTFNVSEFREKCLNLLDGLPPAGIIITKRGRAIARVLPVPSSCVDLIGSVKGLSVDPNDNLFSTGLAWDAQSGHSYPDQGH